MREKICKYAVPRATYPLQHRLSARDALSAGSTLPALPDQQMPLAVGQQEGGGMERTSTEDRHQLKPEVKAGVAEVTLEGWMRVLKLYGR